MQLWGDFVFVWEAYSSEWKEELTYCICNDYGNVDCSKLQLMHINHNKLYGQNC